MSFADQLPEDLASETPTAPIVPFYPDVDHNVSGLGLTNTQYGQFGEAREVSSI